MSFFDRLFAFRQREVRAPLEVLSAPAAVCDMRVEPYLRSLTDAQ